MSQRKRGQKFLFMVPVGMCQTNPGMWCLCVLGIHKLGLSFCRSKNNSLEGHFGGEKEGFKGPMCQIEQQNVPVS